MALSGSIKSSTATIVSSDKYPRHLVLEWSANQSVDKNTSTISYTIRAGGNNTSSWCRTGAIKVTMNGTTIYEKSSAFKMYSKQVLKTGTLTVTHNTDGSKVVPVTITAGIYAYTSSNSTYDGSFTLNTIPRASSISVTTANIGEKPTISISRASKNFTHTLRYEFGSLTGTVVSKTTATTYSSWAIPSEFYSQIPDGKTKTGTMYCDTYSGSTKIGTKSATFRVNVPNSAAPTINPTIRDTNSITQALTGDNKTMVRYFSNVSVTIGATAKNGASIKSQKAVCGNASFTTASGTFNAIESGTFKFTATDSRGLTTEKEVGVNIVNYIKLTCNLATHNPETDGDMRLTISGNYFDEVFGVQSNNLIVEYRYKEDGGVYSDWIVATPDVEAHKYTAEVALTGLDYKTKYIFQARATDKIMKVASPEKAAQSAPVFDWSAEDFNFNVPVMFNGQTVLRHNKDANNVVLSASGGFIYFRSGGTDDTTAQFRLTPQGNLDLMEGDILIGGKSLKSLLGID
jgi:hypothetical protein